MENTETVLRLLHNSGFHNVKINSEVLVMDDPTCVVHSFSTFFDYAWVAMALITGFLLIGWAISLIRGATYNNLFINLRNLTFLFLILTLVRPVVNFVYGDDIFSKGCDTITIPRSEIDRLMKLREEQLEKFNEFGFFENIQIHDSGATETTSTEQM